MSKKKEIGYYIHLVVTIAIMALFYVIPPFGGLTDVGMRVIGATLGAVYGWCTFGLAIPSILAIVSMGLSGYCTVQTAFANAASDSNTLYVLMLCIFAGFFACSNVSKGLAMRIVSWKVANGKPWVLTVLLLLATFVVSLGTGGIPATFIMWTLLQGICDECEIERGNPWAAVTAFFITVIGQISFVWFPFSVTVTGMFGILKSMEASAELNYGGYFALSTLILAATFALFFVVMRFIVKPDVTKIKNYKPKPKEEMPAFNFKQKCALYSMAVLIIILFLPTILSGTGIAAALNKVGTTGIVALIIAAMLVIREDGKPVFTMKEIVYSGVSWDMMFMMAAAFALGAALQSADCGVTAAIGAVLSPLFVNLQPMVFFILFTAAMLLITACINNTVTAFIMLPIMISYAQQTDISLLVPMFASVISVCLAGFLMPSGSPAGALLYGNRELLNPKQVVTYSLLTMLIIFIVAVAAFPIACMLLG